MGPILEVVQMLIWRHIAAVSYAVLAAGRWLGPLGILVHMSQLIRQFLKTYSDIRHTGVSRPLVSSPRYRGSSLKLYTIYCANKMTSKAFVRTLYQVLSYKLTEI